MMASQVPPTQSLFKCGLRILGERQRGEPTIGDVLLFFEGPGLWDRSDRQYAGTDIPLVTRAL